MIDGPSREKIFHKRLLNMDGVGAASIIQSPAVTSKGNRVVCTLTIENIDVASPPTLTLYLDGSYNGSSWQNVTSISRTTTGYVDSSATFTGQNLFTWLRLRAEMTGTTGKSAIFSSDISFSEV